MSARTDPSGCAGETARRYTVGQVAHMAHVTVRALHHYDEIGLLEPSERSPAGYRLYGDADLRRLHHILLLRQLDIPLDAIRQVLDDPAFDHRAALRPQRERLVEQVQRMEAVLAALDATLEALEEGSEMDAEKVFGGFGRFDPSRYEEEARERWGDTDAYRESTRRTRRYGAEQWAAIRAEGDAIMAAWAELLTAGRNPDEGPVLEVAERHRLHIDRWFYPCAHAMHAGLADMYEATLASRPRSTDGAKG